MRRRKNKEVEAKYYLGIDRYLGYANSISCMADALSSFSELFFGIYRWKAWMDFLDQYI
jgi:hypothetical protein